MSETFWHPDDKEWMKARTEEWRPVKECLENLNKSCKGLLKKKYQKHHRELFLYGTVDESLVPNGGEAFEDALPVFQLWYHPQPDRLDKNSLIQAYMRKGTMRGLREHFFNRFYSHGSYSHNIDVILFSPVTGMMNGREEDVVKMICPEYDFKKVIIENPHSNTSTTGQTGSFHPYHLEVYLLIHSRFELIHDARFIPYAPGQYLWDHLSYAAEHYPDLVFRPPGLAKPGDEEMIKKQKNNIMEIMAEALAFENRTDKSSNRPSTIAFVEGLINRYENKTFSDPILALWDEAKQNIDSLLETSAILINKSQEEIKKNHYLSLKEQQERIEQWKQV